MSATIAIELDSIEGDISELERAEQAILDTMLLYPSTDDDLLPALRLVHAVGYSLRQAITDEAKPEQAVTP